MTQVLARKRAECAAALALRARIIVAPIMARPRGVDPTVPLASLLGAAQAREARESREAAETENILARAKARQEYNNAVAIVGAFLVRLAQWCRAQDIRVAKASSLVVVTTQGKFASLKEWEANIRRKNIRRVRTMRLRAEWRYYMKRSTARFMLDIRPI